MRENEITGEIVDVAYQIHTKLGPGLFESVYEAVMAYELEKRELKFERQKPIPLINKGVHLEEGFRADFIVENQIIVELKSIETVAPCVQKTTPDLPPSHQQASRSAHKLQHRAYQTGYHSYHQQPLNPLLLSPCLCASA